MQKQPTKPTPEIEGRVCDLSEAKFNEFADACRQWLFRPWLSDDSWWCDITRDDVKRAIVKMNNAEVAAWLLSHTEVEEEEME